MIRDELEYWGLLLLILAVQIAAIVMMARSFA